MCLKYIKRVIARKKEKLDEWESKYYSVFPAEVAERTVENPGGGDHVTRVRLTPWPFLGLTIDN